MNIHAEVDDPAEVALKYCEEHGLDYAEHGPHVEVEIHKDMLDVCRQRIIKLRTQRDDLKFKIEKMNDSSLCARLKQAAELLKGMETKKAKLERHLEEVVAENANYKNLVSWHSDKAKEAENKAKKSNVNTELKYYVEKKQIKTTTSVTIQQIKAECEALVQKKNIEHQQLLESATAEAMDRANESEREVQVQIAALKVLSLSKDEEIAKLTQTYEEKLCSIQGNVTRLDKIIESNKQIINDRNNKIKALKESYETKIQQHQKKYKKNTRTARCCSKNARNSEHHGGGPPKRRCHCSRRCKEKIREGSREVTQANEGK